MTQTVQDTTQPESSDDGSTRAGLTRALLMVCVAILFGFGQSLLGLIAIAQVIWLLATGKPNERIASFGTSLSRWFAEAARYQSCSSEDKPFPWKTWPEAS